DVVPVTDKGGNDANLGIDVLGATLERAKARHDGGELRPTDHPDGVRPRHRPGEHPGEIRGVVESERQSGEVRSGGAPRCCYENSMRKLWRDATRGVLKLEPVTEHEVISLAPVLTEILVELGRGLRLDVADLGAK